MTPKQSQTVNAPQSGYVSITNTSFTFIAVLAMIPTAYYLWKRHETQNQERICMGCGRGLTDYPDGMKVCPYCGKNLDEKEDTKPEPRVSDSDITRVAAKYTGVITKTVVVHELGIRLDDAERILNRFCEHGEARKTVVGPYTVYIFHSALDQLTGLQRSVIEILLQHEAVSRIQLIDKTSVSIDALEEVVADLERRGIIVRNRANDTISLHFPKT